MKAEFICSDKTETEELGKKFASCIKNEGAFVSLSGVVGAGKTEFTRFVCKYLEIKEKVTSPSFVILNEYKTGIIPVYHFDLYRLEHEGVKSIINELEEYSEGKIATFVEWAEFSCGNLPFDKIELKIEIIDNTARKFSFCAEGEKHEKIIERLLNENSVI